LATDSIIDYAVFISCYHVLKYNCKWPIFSERSQLGKI